MRLTGFAALATMVLQIVLAVWGFYLTIKIAQHVGAWPFG